MLQIQQRSPSPSGRWELSGWPALTQWGLRPELPLLYWALREIPAAAAAADSEVLDDLLLEVELWLERIWRAPPPTRGKADAGDLLNISAALWAEVQLGRSSADMLQIALHARKLSNLFAPTGTDPTRPVDAVPRYVPVVNRIQGGHLPLTLRPVGIHGRALDEQFLLLLAAVLSNRGGYLAGNRSDQTPRLADPVRTGWAQVDTDPAGTLLGSIEDTGRGFRLLLRPRPCLTAVNRIRGKVGNPAWDPVAIGRSLASCWLTDTTLVDAKTPRRIYTVAATVCSDRRPEQVWILPIETFHPHQFFLPAPPQPRRKGTHLRPVPTV